MSGVWELEGSFGAERWVQKDGQFNQVVVASETFLLPRDTADVADLGARRSTCGHGVLWPGAFKFCPQCGTRLSAAAPTPQGATWSAPFGASNGLPVINDAGVPVPAKRMEVQMGTAGSFGFFAAGNPGALFRYDLKSGRLFRAIGIDDAAPGETSLPVVWDEMSPRLAPATGLPRWSWAVSAHATGAAIPTDAGAVWLTRAPGRRTKTIPLEAAGRSVRAIGGAALVRDAAVVPVSVDGRVRFALWVFDKAAWALVDLDAGPDAPAGDTYAAPVSNGDEAFWSGKAGLLRINESGGTMSGEFVPWPEGFRPQLGIRPVELPDGGFHLFGRIGNQQLAYQAMLPGKATPQRREARGYSISYGGGVFREGKRYRQPWDQDSLGTYTVDDGFIAPLLAFAESRFLVAVCSQRTELSKFLETPAGGRLLSCKLAICGPVSSLDPLQQVVEANAVWELMPFVYAGRLFVYAAVENRCWAWPLLAAGPK